MRYELLTGGEPATSYFVAVRIVEMDEADRALLKQYLRRAKGRGAKRYGLTADSGRAATQGV